MADLERKPIAKPNLKPVLDPAAEVVVLIDGAHIWAAHGYQSRHLDVTVGKIEVTGKPTQRFAFTPRSAESPLATPRQALRNQGWQPGRPVTVLSNGDAALPGLVRAAVGEPITCILDWLHIRNGDASPCQRSLQPAIAIKEARLAIATLSSRERLRSTPSRLRDGRTTILA